MRLRRFALLAVFLAFLHGALTVASLVIVFDSGINLDHPEIEPSYLQRLCGVLLNVLMQPLSRIWDSPRVRPTSSLLEWAAMFLNSLAWGVTVSMIAILFTRGKRFLNGRVL